MIYFDSDYMEGAHPRFVTSWATTEEDVEKLVEKLQ